MQHTTSPSRAQIIATIGPASAKKPVLEAMVDNQLDIARLNFSWGDHEGHAHFISLIREVGTFKKKEIPIIQDLPGPRIQEGNVHSFAEGVAVTEEDKKHIAFGATQGVEYVAISFVSSANDILTARDEIERCGGSAQVIAKIERQEALDNLDEIVDVSDAIMIARGDLGSNIPLETVPFVEVEIIQRVRSAGKPVIVATEMMWSMTERERPTRAEVTDIAFAITHGADAVMLSEETAIGKNPISAVQMMELIVVEAEKRSSFTLNKL